MKQYVRRDYRQSYHSEDLVYYRVRLKQSDLSVGTTRNLHATAIQALASARSGVEEAIAVIPSFATSMIPLPLRQNAAPIEKRMISAAALCGVGPMAAVAGAIAESVGEALLHYSQEVIVENGGDLFLSTTQQRKIAVFAGDSPFSNRIALVIPPGCWGVCTSSGVIGPSKSYGCAHAAVIIAANAAFADAMATAMGNRIQQTSDLDEAVNWAMTLPDTLGALAILSDKMAVAGAIELAPL